MAAAAAQPEQEALASDAPDSDDNIFTKTLAALQHLQTDMVAIVARLPSKETLALRQRELAEFKGSTKTISVIDGTATLRLRGRIGDGSFGVVFAGFMLSDDIVQTSGKQVAIKIEVRGLKRPNLREEFRILRKLEGCAGVPRVYHFGEIDFHKALVMDLLGPSVERYLKACGGRFSIKTVAMLGKQMVSRLHAVHEKGFVHRDVKPENILVGVPGTTDVTTVYLVDFGLAIPYRDSDTGEHIKDDGEHTRSGTMRYMGVHAHSGHAQGRRDDLVALGNVLIYLLQGKLPWEAIPNEPKETYDDRMLDIKKSTSVEELCAGYPPEFAEYINYTRNLGFSKVPAYAYLCALFSRVLSFLGAKDDAVYDWMLPPIALPTTKTESAGVLQAAGPSAAANTTAQNAAAVTQITQRAKTTRTFFYDSTTQNAVYFLSREINKSRYDFHRRVGTADVARLSRVSSTFYKRTAAFTASALTAVRFAEGPAPPDKRNNRVKDWLATIAGGSGINVLPTSVISPTFANYMDKQLREMIVDLEAMSDQQLQNRDWSIKHKLVCLAVTDLVAAARKEQESVRAAYAKWKEEVQAENPPSVDAPAADAAPTVPQDDGGPSFLEVDMPLQLEVDDDQDNSALAGGTPVPDLPGTAGPPRGGDASSDGDNDDEETEEFTLVYRTASGSKKVMQLKTL